MKTNKVLLIEDNPDHVHMIRDILNNIQDMHFDLECTSQLSNGLELLARGDVNVILLDLSLPDSQGIDSFIKTQAQAPDLPIIVMSSLDDINIAIKAVDAGAQDYLVKGEIDSNLLARSIYYAIERKRVEIALKKAHDELEIKVKERTADIVKINEKLKAEIYERKRIEKALIYEREKLKKLYDHSPDAIVVLDKDYTVLYANDNTEKLSGISKSELKGRKCYEGIIGISTACDGCMVKEVLRKKESQNRIKHEITKNGDENWLWQIWYPVFDKNGNLEYIVEIAKNITDLKKAEKTLKEESDKAQRYLDIAGVVILVLDVAGKITLVNKKGCEILGVECLDTKCADIIGKDWFSEFIPEKDRESIKTVFSKLMAGEITPVEYYENVVLTRTGQEKTIAWHNTVLKDENGEIIGTLSSGEDITERKAQADNLEEMNSALRVLLKNRDNDKDMFEEKVLSNMQELIIPYLEKMKKVELSSRHNAFLHIIESNLKDIVSSFSLKLSSKYSNLTPTEIQIANLIRYGNNTKEIAELLSLAKTTVETHRRRIRKKLGINNKETNLRTHLLSFR